jgi:hypothetical protein
VAGLSRERLRGPVSLSTVHPGRGDAARWIALRKNMETMDFSPSPSLQHLRPGRSSAPNLTPVAISHASHFFVNLSIINEKANPDSAPIQQIK